ncbi:tRNA (N6-isopentenyl adenosine(37)-C2)-methylthiotransferase MiaB [Candidatus Parcubacteria bacterium]|nr:tRNA (N6-isopentenyl adenosine(37)-C2)-methylthiotransferase MiaB [Candidatus Parcubacteria bacterium]
MSTYHITTLGCAMNLSDSERIASKLENLEYTQASSQKDADLIVINMCSIRQAAVDRVIAIKNKLRPNQKTILTGCIVKDDISKLSKIFDYILPIKSLSVWEKYLNQNNAIGFAKERRMPENELLNISYLKGKAKYGNNFSINIPISYGCNNFCSYCVVPYTRGPLVCRNPKDIIQEAKNAIKNGAKEIWLLGQNVNDYKYKIKKIEKNQKDFFDFSDLVYELNDIPGDFWIRFTSPHPAQMSDNFIDAIAKCQKMTPYINFPVQAGNDDVLKNMNRPYTIKQYKALVKKIRARFKKFRQGDEKTVALSTDIIVGFPNETEKQFRNTVKLMEDISFDMAYIAEYSPRKGTPAAKIDNIKNYDKKERFRILNNALSKEVLKNNKKFVGKTLRCLVFNKKPGKNIYFAKTRHYKTVVFNSDKNLIGEFANLKIKKAESFILQGELCNK